MASRAYIAPWQNPELAKALIIGFVGNCTYGMLSFMLNFSMAQEGFTQSIVYHIVRLPLMGFFAVPLTFWIIAHLKSRATLAALQITGSLLFLIDMTSGALNAIAFSLLATSYWSLYNIRYSKNQSRENHGNETALSWFMVVVAYSLGLLLGGVFLEKGWLFPATLALSALLIVVTQMLVTPMRDENHWAEAKKMIGFKKPTSRLTVLANMQSIIMEGCMPIWMSAIGITPIAAGFNLALRPFLATLLTPIAGYLIQKGGLKSTQVGGASITIGWLLLAATQGLPALLAPAMTFLSMGSNFIVPGELSRWYKRRSAGAILAREILLVYGRVPAFAMALPIIFFAPVLYPVFGLGVTFLFALGMRPTRKGLSAPPVLRVDS